MSENLIERAREWLNDYAVNPDACDENPDAIINDLLSVVVRLSTTEDGEYVAHPYQVLYRLWHDPKPSDYSSGLPIAEGRANWWWGDIKKDGPNYASKCRYFSTRQAAEAARG